MRHQPHALSVLALLATGLPAAADTLAAEIWAEWQAQSELTGQTLTATVTETETGLTLSDVLTLAIEEGVESRAEIAEVRLIENPDGTLSVEMNDDYRLSFAFDDVFTGVTNTVTAVMTFEGLDIDVSGDAGARVYTYAGDRLSIGDLTIETPGDTPPSVDIDLIVSDFSSTYRLFGTDLETMRFADETNIGAMALLVDFAPPAPEPGRLKFGLQYRNLGFSSEGSMITLAGPQMYIDGVPPGLDLQLDSAYERLDLEFSMQFPQPFQDQLTSIEVNYANAGGTAAVAFSNASLAFETGATDVSFLMNMSDLPVPLAVEAAMTGFAFAIPMEASDTPQDVELSIGYTDLSMGEAMWGLFDPAALIPRDPARIILDARAQVQVFVDLLSVDPDALIAPPGELRGLNIDDLRISAGGAELTGSADLEFAPGQIVPMPAGQANVTLTGANALLDALVAAGLVPQEEAAIGQAMVLGFTSEGEGEDSRATVLEFDGAGGVTSNGLPLPF